MGDKWEQMEKPLQYKYIKTVSFCHFALYSVRITLELSWTLATQTLQQPTDAVSNIAGADVQQTRPVFVMCGMSNGSAW